MGWGQREWGKEEEYCQMLKHDAHHQRVQGGAMGEMGCGGHLCNGHQEREVEEERSTSFEDDHHEE